MPKYNLYKVVPDKEHELIKKLKSIGLKCVKTETRQGFTYNFYFSETPSEIDIWWVTLYKDFLGSVGLPKNTSYFGVLLLTKNNVCYAISLGKSHFYLKNYCETDFGMNLAERIVDYDKLKMKNSKLFGGQKNKTITSYLQDSPVEYDSGESMQYIKASTVDEKNWGKTVSFGQSVQFSVEVTPKQLPAFLNKIEAALKENPKFNLPRAEEIKDTDFITQLDNKLAEDIMDEETQTETGDFSLSGVDFVFSDDHEYSFYLRGKGASESGPLSIQRLRDYVLENDIDLPTSLNSLKVRIVNESGGRRSQDVKSVLDYVDNERHCLLEGKWYRFTQSYVDYLKQEADRVIIDLSLPEILKPNTEEKDFNQSKETEGYINFDRHLTALENFRIEKMDLYKDETLYFVKFGTPQKLSYTIDQAMATVKVLQNHASRIEIDGTSVEPHTICLWLFFDRQRDIQKLSELNSLIFLMKLAEWRKTVRNAGFSPVVKIGYIRGESKKTASKTGKKAR